jgi:hypothetical protein
MKLALPVADVGGIAFTGRATIAAESITINVPVKECHANRSGIGDPESLSGTCQTGGYD